MSDSVQYDMADAVATITLNRPEAMNALDTVTKESLRDAVNAAADDTSVRAVILTGSGRAFCVGQDLREHVENVQHHPAEVWRTVPDHYNPIALGLATMPKPVVAAIGGVAAGAGAAFALACDFRIIAESAGFNFAFTAVGLTADSGASWTLPRLVGAARATELLMQPSTIPAARAHQLGLVTEVVADGEVLPRARALAAQLAAGPTVAYGAVKRALAYGASHDLADTLAFEAQMQALAGSTRDHLAAVSAFLAKQQPVFRGE